MAGHGGKRSGSGRKPGAVSKAKRDLAASAKAHSEAALNTLAAIMKAGKSETARIAAANAILDRGYGKPFQAAPPAGEGDTSVSDALRDIAQRLPG